MGRPGRRSCEPLTLRRGAASVRFAGTETVRSGQDSESRRNPVRRGRLGEFFSAPPLAAPVAPLLPAPVARPCYQPVFCAGAPLHATARHCMLLAGPVVRRRGCRVPADDQGRLCGCEQGRCQRCGGSLRGFTPQEPPGRIEPEARPVCRSPSVALSSEYRGHASCRGKVPEPQPCQAGARGLGGTRSGGWRKQCWLT